MRREELEAIQRDAEMAKLFYEPSMHKTAQDGLSNIIGKIKEEVDSKYDPNNPVESILGFLAPGILWLLGFRWIAVIYEIAAALGFDWTHFFASIKEKLRPFITGLSEGKEGNSSEIDNAVQASATESFGDKFDPAHLKDVVEKYTSLNSVFFIKKVAIRTQIDNNLMHTIEKWISGAAGNRMRKGVLGFIIRIMSWIIAAVLISAGFAVVGGVASRILGVKKKPQQSGEEASTTETTSYTQKETSETPADKQKVQLVLNTKADPTLFSTSYNDTSHVWLLNMNVSHIKESLIRWAQQLYPQLTDEAAFEASSSFNRTLKMFQDRNRTAGNIEILAVPPPFKSIKEIVDSFAADVASHMS